ncbi:Cytochrome P450 3A40-like 2 [Homarus americanus]|uniref:Thromboxane-A synthase n=2 Tax=Homarus americanus TaxID=6706 RepID=A0A8J5NC64_HOMAM|nr:Cytochrome P450 3A40-like 2 [Homarus americanus]
MSIVGVLVWVIRWLVSHAWTLLAATLLLYIASWVKQRRRQHSVFARLGIPYVQPHIIYGSNHVLRAPGALATDLVGQWLKKYGKVFGFYVGWQPNLVVADLDLVKQILVKEFQNFSNRPTLVIDAQPVVDCLVGLRDQRWKDVRSVLAPTFSVMKMKFMASIMNEKVDELLSIVAKKVEQDKPIEWHTTFQGMTLDVISQCALALKTHCQRDQEGEDFFLAVRQFLKNAVNPAILLALYFKMFAKFLSFVSNRLAYSGRLTQMIIKHLKAVIAIRRQYTGTKYLDVLQLMLDAAESQPDHSGEETVEDSSSNTSNTWKENRQKRFLTDEEIIANAWVFLLGGFETTANSVTYTSYLLGTHPEVQERVYQELCDVLQDSPEELSYEQVHSLKYLDQVFCEALRLYPPAVNFVSREAAQDIQLGDLLIPKNMSIQIPLWHIHRDPEHWPDAETFDPERFSPEAKASVSRHPMAYLPFGAGPRNCPGIRFGQLEAKLAVARVIRRYKLVAYGETPIPLTFEIPTVTLNPSKGVYMKAVPRIKSE